MVGHAAPISNGIGHHKPTTLPFIRSILVCRIVPVRSNCTGPERTLFPTHHHTHTANCRLHAAPCTPHTSIHKHTRSLPLASTHRANTTGRHTYETVRLALPSTSAGHHLLPDSQLDRNESWTIGDFLFLNTARTDCLSPTANSTTIFYPYIGMRYVVVFLPYFGSLTGPGLC